MSAALTPADRRRAARAGALPSPEARRYVARVLEALAAELGDHSTIGGRHLGAIAAAEGADVVICDTAEAAVARGADPAATVSKAISVGRDVLSGPDRQTLVEAVERIGAETREEQREARAEGWPDPKPDVRYQIGTIVRRVAVRMPPERRGDLATWAGLFAAAVEP